MRIEIGRVVSALKGAGLFADIRGELPEVVTGISDDSRSVSLNSLFLAVKGSARDGHDFLSTAEKLGASAAMVEDPPMAIHLASFA